MKWARTFLMAMAVLSALVLTTHAQTPSPAKAAPVPSDGSSTFDRQSIEQLSKKQYKATDAPDKYDPSHPDLKRTFNLSGKGFISSAVSPFDQQALQKLPAYHGNTYNGTLEKLTLPKAVVNTPTSLSTNKSYTATAAYTTTTPTFHVNGGRNNGFSQTYSLPAKAVFTTQAAYPSDKAYPDSNKTYDGPEAKKEQQSMAAVQALSSVSNVPNRTLTVDEVKSLLNNGHLPNEEQESRHSVPALPVEDPNVKPAEPLTLPQR